MAVTSSSAILEEWVRLCGALESQTPPLAALNTLVARLYETWDRIQVDVRDAIYILVQTVPRVVAVCSRFDSSLSLPACSPLPPARVLLAFALDASQHELQCVPVALMTALTLLLVRADALEVLVRLASSSSLVLIAVCVAAVHVPGRVLAALLRVASRDTTLTCVVARVLASVALHDNAPVMRLLDEAVCAATSPSALLGLLRVVRHSALLSRLALRVPALLALVPLAESRWARMLSLCASVAPSRTGPTRALHDSRRWRLSVVWLQDATLPVLAELAALPVLGGHSAVHVLVRDMIRLLEQAATEHPPLHAQCRLAVVTLTRVWQRVHAPRDEHARPPVHAPLHAALVTQLLSALVRVLSRDESGPTTLARSRRELRAHVYTLCALSFPLVPGPTSLCSAVCLMAHTSPALESAVVAALVDALRASPALRVPWARLLGASAAARTVLADVLLGELVPAFPSPAIESYSELLPRKPSWPRDVAVEALFTQHPALWPLLAWLVCDSSVAERCGDVLATLLAALIGSWHAAEAAASSYAQLVARTQHLLRVLAAARLLAPCLRVLEALVPLLPSTVVTSLLHELVWPALLRARSSTCSAEDEGALQRRLRALVLRHVALPGVATLIAHTMCM